MSDEHHEHDGGHELEALDAGQLFRLIGGMTIVVLISIIAVIQWFHKQQAELRVTNSDYSFLRDHHEREDKMLEGIDGVAKKVAGDASTLAAPPPPTGWVHPDDVKGGAAPTGGEATPAGGAGHGDEEKAPGGVPSGADDEVGGADGEAGTPEDATAEGADADAEGDDADAEEAGDEKSAGEKEPAAEDSAEDDAKAETD